MLDLAADFVWINDESAVRGSPIDIVYIFCYSDVIIAMNGNTTSNVIVQLILTATKLKCVH